MKFKFSSIEGLDPEIAAKLDADANVAAALEAHLEAAASEAVEAAGGGEAPTDEAIEKRITDAVNARVDVAKQGFKAKMDAMAAKVKAAEEALAAAPDIDPEELEALRQAREQNPELQQTLERMKAEVTEKTKALEQQRAELANERRDRTLFDAFDEYNRENETTKLRADMRDLATMLGRERVRYDEEANAYRVLDKTGEVLATDKGAATPLDFVAMLRKERPGMFETPTGSGAPGSGTPAPASEKRMTRAEFSAITDPAKRSEVARTYTIDD